MTEQRLSYALPKSNIPRTIPDIGALSEAETELILLLRRAQAKSPRPMIVIEQLGDAVRLHETYPSKHIRT